jgi:acylphosphatase
VLNIERGMIARRIYFEGKVQGVGFRYTTKRIAMGFDVVGSVANLPDGRVCLEVAGDSCEVADFIEEVKDGELAGFIREYHQEDVPLPVDWQGFEIVR